MTEPTEDPEPILDACPECKSPREELIETITELDRWTACQVCGMVQFHEGEGKETLRAKAEAE